MKFLSEKKQAIVLYLLEKIEEGVPSLSRTVSQALGISPNTVHTYLNELMADGVIQKGKRGRYELVTRAFQYVFLRSQGHLNSDTHAFDAAFRAHIEAFAENVQQIWSYAFSEMVNNVMDHSGAERMHVLVRQSYLRTDVLIIDDGVGIFEKIKRHFSLADTDEAICELFKGKLTTDSQNHSGEGIFFASKMMDAFVIFSGGKVFATTKYENAGMADAELPLSGTCVLMSLGNFTHKRAEEVFDLYANMEGGFVRTRIPLKNIFASSPVSRSQARRVSNRLDQFQEVVLDFDEITWMGQGFAHQLFVVYQNAHPEIKLIAENMNENVEKMYRHVLQTS